MSENVLDSVVYLLSDKIGVKVSNYWLMMKIWILRSLGWQVRITLSFIESYSLSLEGNEGLLNSVEPLVPMMMVTSIVAVIWVKISMSTLCLQILGISEELLEVLIIICVFFKVCLSVWHWLINDSEHNFWNLRRILDFQKGVRVRFILLTVFTKIKVFANATLVSWPCDWSYSAAITLNVEMSYCWFNLLRLILLNLTSVFLNFLAAHIFFLFFNNTLDQLFRLLIQRIFDHFFDCFFLFFPNLLLKFFWRFSNFFPFLRLLSIFSWFRTVDLEFFNFRFNFLISVWITWSLVLFFSWIFTFRFIFILLRLRIAFTWNLFLLLLNKIFKERFRIVIGIFLHRIIYQATFLGDCLIRQDLEFQVLVLLALGPVIGSMQVIIIRDNNEITWVIFILNSEISFLRDNVRLNFKNLVKNQIYKALKVYRGVFDPFGSSLGNNLENDFVLLWKFWTNRFKVSVLPWISWLTILLHYRVCTSWFFFYLNLKVIKIY